MAREKAVCIRNFLMHSFVHFQVFQNSTVGTTYPEVATVVLQSEKQYLDCEFFPRQSSV